MSAATDAIRFARDQLWSAENLDQACAEFHWPDVSGPFNWAIDWFDAVGRDRADVALWIREEDGTESKFSWHDMVQRSDRLAAWFRDQGIQAGDRVIVMLGNQVEIWDAQLALMKIGGVILPTAIALNPIDLADRIERAEVKAVITNPHETEKFDVVPGDYLRISAGNAPDGWLSLADAQHLDAEPQPIVTTAESPVLAYFTSGTTNRPKLVEHTHQTYPVGHLSTTYFIGSRPGDVHLNISSPGWGKHAWSSFFAPWIAEATVFVYNYLRFDAADLLAQLRAAGVNTFCAPPTVWRMMILADLGSRPEGLRQIVGAGEPLNPEVISAVQRAWGLTIRDGYGQTETTAQVGNVPGEKIKIGSMGRPLPGVPVVVLDPDTGLPSNHGEICIELGENTKNLFTGYVGAPQLTQQALRNGYYHTGDLVSVDAEGYFTYVGRDDDVFKASDYKVSPFELESVLMEHPAVAEVAVVPSPDPTRLAVPKAYVALAPGFERSRETAASILRHAKEQLPAYLRVRRVEFEELPKALSGKIRRVVLRAREALPVHERENPHNPEYRYEDFPELKGARRQHNREESDK